jgi:hypothetical protein
MKCPLCGREIPLRGVKYSLRCMKYRPMGDVEESPSGMN